MHTEKTGLNAHTERQLRHLKYVDTITADPHKSGFAPYPAGSLLYRDRRMPEMIQITAPVVYHGGDAPTVGVFGVEGSKPGAAAAGVYFSQRSSPSIRAATAAFWAGVPSIPSAPSPSWSPCSRISLTSRY